MEARTHEPAISVVIATCSRYNLLDDTLRDLSQQTRSPAEIIVVDTTPAEDRRDPDASPIGLGTKITHISSRSFGRVNRARNEGLKRVKSEYVLLLDDDMELPSDCLEKILIAHASGADAVHGALLEKGLLVTSLHRRDRPLWAVLRHRHTAGRCHTIAVSSGFVSIRMEALRAINYLDEAFIYSYDDWDLGYRLWSSGYITIHDPAVQGTHLRASYGGARELVTGQRGHLNKLTAKYYFLLKHFSARAMRIELLTDLIFALADRNWNPFAALGDWRISTKAYRAASGYHLAPTGAAPPSPQHNH